MPTDKAGLARRGGLEQALEAYRASDLFAEVAGNPAFANATVRAFGRLEGPSKVTRC